MSGQPAATKSPAPTAVALGVARMWRKLRHGKSTARNRRGLLSPLTGSREIGIDSGGVGDIGVLELYVVYF